MAKVPRFSTPSAGQGMKRKSYQVGRTLGNRGSSSPAGGAGSIGQSLAPRSLPQPSSGGGSSGGIASGVRSYPKGDPVSAQYGPPVMDPNNLGAVQAIGKMKPPGKGPKGFSF